MLATDTPTVLDAVASEHAPVRRKPSLRHRRLDASSKSRYWWPAIKGMLYQMMQQMRALNNHPMTPAWPGVLPVPTVRQWHSYFMASPSRSTTMLGDLAAGLVVAVMLIPQGMAYAQLAGMPPINGLYASIFALLVYPWFSTAPQLAVGPVAMVSLLSSAAITEFAEPGTVRFIQLSMMLALISAVFQLLLGALRAGFIVNFLSHPVLHGFTSAAALVIGSSQLGKLLGVKIPRSKYFYMTIYEAASRLGDVHVLTLVLAVENILLFVLIKWLKQKGQARYAGDDPKSTFRRSLVTSTPTALIVMIVNLLLVAIFSLKDEGVAVIGEIPSGLPDAFEVFDGVTTSSWWEDLQALAMPALVLSLVGFMESISIAKAMAAKYPAPAAPALSSNQELKAIGLANLGAALFGGFPVTGGFSRTSVQGGAGATTPLSSVVSAVLLLLTVLFLTTLFENLPDVTLGATIVVAVAKLIDFHTPILLWRVSKPDCLVFATAFFATLILGIEDGIITACLLSLLIVIQQTTAPHFAVLGRVGGTTLWRNVTRFADAVAVPGVMVLRFDARLYFANAGGFKDLVLRAARIVAEQPTPCAAGTDTAAMPTSTAAVSVVIDGADATTAEAAPVTDVVDAAETAPEADVTEPVRAADDDADADSPATRIDAADGEDTKAEEDAKADDKAPDTTPTSLAAEPAWRFSAQDRHVVVDMGAVSHVDYSAVHTVLELSDMLETAGLGHVHLWLCNVRGPVRDALRLMLAVEHEHTAKAGESGEAGAVGAADVESGSSSSPLAVADTPLSDGLDTRLFAVDVDTAVAFVQARCPVVTSV